MNDAFFLSHNGLGDNITNIGAVNFILQYYGTIYFICKSKYQDNLKLIFNSKNVVLVPFSASSMMEETINISQIINKIDPSRFDLFVSGNCHKKYFKSYITVPEIITYEKNHKYIAPYTFINDFYNDIHLDASVYVDYFHIKSTENSIKYYELVKQYQIIFIHIKGSDRSISLELTEYEDPKYIVVCADGNVYDQEDPRFAIASRFKEAYVSEYIDVILNAKVIEVIDSCFSCIVYPLFLSGKISPEKCVVHEKSGSDGKIKTVLK
jgi:hypothetical protein